MRTISTDPNHKTKQKYDECEQLVQIQIIKQNRNMMNETMYRTISTDPNHKTKQKYDEWEQLVQIQIIKQNRNMMNENN